MGYLQEDRVNVELGEKKREISSAIPEKKERVARFARRCYLIIFHCGEKNEVDPGHP
jgi:hypothetical protein